MPELRILMDAVQAASFILGLVSGTKIAATEGVKQGLWDFVKEIEINRWEKI